MYNSNNIAERIKQLAKSKNIVIKTLLADVGIGASTMMNMKTSMPKADNLAKIADYLGCSVDYLLGRTDIPDDKTPPTSEADGVDINPELEKLIRSLTPESREKLLEFALFQQAQEHKQK